jgi:hypothetical protein
MSHIVHIQTQIRDPVAARAACQRLGLPAPREREVQLFSTTATGLTLELRGWVYPVVCDLATGTIQYDNYGGRWGEPAQLERFLQAYAVEKSRLEAARLGHTLTEQTLSDGSIKLTIQLGGGA